MSALDLTTAHWPAALLALVPALLNLTLFACILAFCKRNALTYTFAAFVMSLTVWQFSDAMVRFSATLETAAFWASILGLGALLIAPAGMEFALWFTGRGHLVRKPWTLIALWCPPVILESFQRAAPRGGNLAADPFWGWTGVGPPSPVTQVYGIWIASLSLGILWVLGDWAFRAPATEPRRRPAMLVAIGFAIPTVQGTITEVIFPTFLHLPTFPIASTMMTTFSICAFVAVRRYEFLRRRTVEDELEEAKGQLERERGLLQQAEQIAHIGSWDWDFANGTVSWSSQMYKLYGVDKSTFHPDPESIQSFFHPDDGAGFRKAIQEAVKDGLEFEHEHRIIRTNGDVRWVIAHGQVKKDANGKPLRLYGTSQDITDRRKAMKEREELERLRSVDEFKTQFLSMAAHELNTPLTPIIAQLYMLKLDHETLKEEDRKKGIEILGRNIERLGTLVSDLLESARIQSGRLRVHPKPVSLAPLVDEVVEAFASTAQRAGVALHGRTMGQPSALADPTRVSQVLYNLVSNAIKFTPTGGSVDVTCQTAGPNVQVSVSDSGIGLDQEQISRLFQPFSRVHEVRGSTVNGTGLGLYISRTICELHGGELTVRSPGHNLGSTFTMMLPTAVATTPTLPIAPRPIVTVGF